MNNPKSAAAIAGHPLHPMIVPFPIAFLVGTLVADIVFAATSDAFWARGAFWLLVAAIVMAALAAVVGLTDFLSERLIRRERAAWYHMIGNVIAVLLSLYNLAIRIRDGAAAGSAGGLWISLVVTLLLLFNGWKGWELVYLHHVAVSDEDPSLLPGE